MKLLSDSQLFQKFYLSSCIINIQHISFRCTKIHNFKYKWLMMSKLPTPFSIQRANTLHLLSSGHYNRALSFKKVHWSDSNWVLRYQILWQLQRYPFHYELFSRVLNSPFRDKCLTIFFPSPQVLSQDLIFVIWLFLLCYFTFRMIMF